MKIHRGEEFIAVDDDKEGTVLERISYYLTLFIFKILRDVIICKINQAT